MRKALALLSLLIAFPAEAQNARTFQILTSAKQPYKCVDVTKASPEDPEPVRQWIIGFWSGMNVGERLSSGGDVGATISANDIYNEIKLYCQKTPSLQLEQAAFNVRQNIKAAGR